MGGRDLGVDRSAEVGECPRLDLILRGVLVVDGVKLDGLANCAVRRRLILVHNLLLGVRAAFIGQDTFLSEVALSGHI